MSLLADAQFDSAVRANQDLLEVITGAYGSYTDVIKIVRRVDGLAEGDFQQKPARQAWEDVFITAGRRQRLRQLIEAIQQDRDSTAIRPVLLSWLDEPAEAAGAPVTAAQRTAEYLLEPKSWDLLAQLLREHVFANRRAAREMSNALPDEFAQDLGLEEGSSGDLDRLIDRLQQSPFEGSRPPILRALSAMLRIRAIRETPDCEPIKLHLEEIRRRVQQGPQEPIDAYLLWNRKVFLDRDRLRDALRELLQRSIAVVVNGEQHTGKSYSLQLIHHIKKEKGFRVVHFTPDAAASPREVIDLLRLDLAIDQEAPTTPKEQAKWNHHASRWLLRELGKLQENLWLVFDGFRGNQLVQEFVGVLGKYIAEKRDSRFRLVLLDFDYRLPSIVGSYREEVLQPLAESDVREFFEDFFGSDRKGVKSTERPLYVKTSLARVWDAARSRSEKEQQPLMRMLNEEVEKITRVYL